MRFSSLIPKMLMFTLAVSCLIASNLPWFMDLTLQVPMKYCFLQPWALLPLTVASTTGHCFHFDSAFSSLLELFLHSSPVAYWTPTDLGNSSFSVMSFCLSYCSWGSQGKTTELVCHSLPFCSLPSGPHFVRTLHHDLSILGGPTRHGSDHELVIAKFRLKLKKVGETTRSFRYDLNQIPYDYTVGVRNRFKGLDLIDRMPEVSLYTWNFLVHMLLKPNLKDFEHYLANTWKECSRKVL